MFETELKFQVPAGSAHAVRVAMKAAAPRRQHLRAIYFDTADGVLAAAGVALRLRQEGSRWVQTLKARGAHAAERHEHNVALPAPRAGTAPRPEPARHAGTPAAEAWRTALGEGVDGFDTARLQPVMATDVWRRAVLLRGDTWVVELAFDEGEVRAGDAVAPVCELEYELVEGSLADLARLAAEGMAHHGLWLDTVSKAERGGLLARGLAHPAPARFAAPRLTRHAGGAAVWRAALASATAMLLPNASALAAGSADPEHVHQLRVAIRRLRCAVGELGGLVAPNGRPAEPRWLAPLVKLFQALGAGRDEAALQAGLAPRLKAAGAPCTDWRDVDAPPSPAPATLLRDTGVQQALLALLVDSQAACAGLGHEATRHQLRHRLAVLHAEAARAGRHFDTLPEPAQHQARKRAKRLRYLAEFVGGLYPAAALARFLKPLAAAQERLGEHQDVLTALPLYQAATARRPEAWFAVGWLVAERGLSARTARKALQALGRAKPFW